MISPVRNEGAHIERVVEAVTAQTRRPDRWIVMDDGSDDGTLERLRELEASRPWMEVRSMPQAGDVAGAPDRLAVAAEARSFNAGLAAARVGEYAFIAKLDGDVELPPQYYAQLLREFRDDPGLGMACGHLVEPRDGEMRSISIPEHHVYGALKLYTRDCFERVGGIREQLAWDTIDETIARMLGYRTRSFRELVAVHHRPWGSAQGTLRGRARHGECAWIVHYPLGFTALRSLKLAVTATPPVISGLAFLWGYGRAALSRTPQFEDERFRRYIRSEIRDRLRGAARRAAPSAVPRPSD